jgi:predicted DNA binding CopG/RHH family protein
MAIQIAKRGSERDMSDRLDKRIVIRLPSDLHRKARIKAAITGMPIAQAVREFLEQWVKDVPPINQQEGEQPPKSE